MSASTYAHRFDRWIKNNSNQNWIITNTLINDQAFFIFDGNLKRGPAACQGLMSANGPCLLSPGKVTYVVYNYTARKNAYLDGILYFSNNAQTVMVQYKGRVGDFDDGITMTSSNESILNDNHGDITIFAHN